MGNRRAGPRLLINFGLNTRLPANERIKDNETLGDWP